MIVNFKISPKILDHLGVSAYTSLKKCLAELCSNSYDADAENIFITLPEKYSSDSKIIIKDDGYGMTHISRFRKHMTSYKRQTYQSIIYSIV